MRGKKKVNQPPDVRRVIAVYFMSQHRIASPSLDISSKITVKHHFSVP